MKTPSRASLRAPAPAPASHPRSGRLAAFGAMILATVCPLAAQQIDLTQYPPIKQSPNATYAYYARGGASGAAITPYTIKFYPGNPHGGNTTTDREGTLADTGSNAASVPFASGDLTDGITSTAVSGWVDIEDAHGAGTADPHPGTFDILFDLGAAYPVSSVELVYTDASGRRWVTSGNYSTQQVSTALVFQGRTPTDADFSPLSSQTFASGATSASIVFSAGVPRPARYINLRLNATLSPSPSGSVGGQLHEVRIFGSPRPLDVAYRADDFVESIGVCTHFKSVTNETDWANNFLVLEPCLGELGIRHIRDDMPITNPNGYNRLQQLYNEFGITTTWMPWAWGRPAPAAADVIARLKTYPFLEAVEGPNEPENAVLSGNSAYSYNGLTDNIAAGTYQGTTAWQNMIYAAIKADPATFNIPVISPAMASPYNLQRLQPLASMDAAGMHSYPSGTMPSADDHFYFGTTVLPTVRSLAGDRPIVVTETGYHNALNTARTHPPVTAAVAAKYTPRLYAEYLLHGISATFVHQLIDDGGGTAAELDDQEHNFGWLTYDLAHKPVFDAMRRLIAHLREATWQTATKQWTAPAYLPGVLDYTLSGGGPSLRRLLLKKASGERILVLWNEVPSYYYSRTETTLTQNPIINPDVPVTLTFNERIASASVYRLGSDAAQQVVFNPVSLQVGVPDELLLVKLSPATLPAPWGEQNVGTVGVAGSTSATDSTTFSVSGAGIGTVPTGDADAFHLVSQNISGDTTIVARVSSIAAKAGLTIRENADANARHATIALQTGNSVSFQRRTTTGQPSASTNATGLPSPRWLKLVRAGNVFSAWHSPDGTTWAQIGEITITMSPTALAGLVVCSGSSTTTQTAIFDQLAITNSVPVVTIHAADPVAASAPSDPASFVVTRTGSTAASLTVNYTLTGTAVNGIHYNAPASVTISADAPSATVAIAPTSNVNAAGRRSIIATLAPSAAYKVGDAASEAVSLRMGDGVLDDFEIAPLSGWGTATPSTSTVARETGAANIHSGTGALRWTFTPNSAATNNEIRLNFTAPQDWSAAAKLVLWLKEADGNPAGDFSQPIYYDYRTTTETSVSGNAGVGSIALTRASGYRRIELDLGQFNRSAVTRLYLYVNGTALYNISTAPRTWYIDDLTFEDAAGHTLPLYASTQRAGSLDAYGEWKLAHGLPADIDDRSAPDGDGIPVLMKFATSLLPGTPASEPPAALVRSAEDRLALRFNRRSPAPVAYRVEASSDLSAWSSLASLAHGADGWQGSARVTESDQGDPRLVLVEDVIPVSAYSRRFLRLSVARALP